MDTTTIQLLPERDRAMAETYTQPLPGKPTGEATSTYAGVHTQAISASDESTEEAESQFIVENTQTSERELVTKPVTARPKAKPRGGGQARTA